MKPTGPATAFIKYWASLLGRTLADASLYIKGETMHLLDTLLAKPSPSGLTVLVGGIIVLTLIRRPEAWVLLGEIGGRVRELKFLWFHLSFFEPKGTRRLPPPQPRPGPNSVDSESPAERTKKRGVA